MHDQGFKKRLSPNFTATAMFFPCMGSYIEYCRFWGLLGGEKNLKFRLKFTITFFVLFQ